MHYKTSKESEYFSLRMILQDHKKNTVPVLTLCCHVHVLLVRYIDCTHTPVAGIHSYVSVNNPHIHPLHRLHNLNMGG